MTHTELRTPLHTFFPAADQRRVHAGTLILRQGEFGEVMYVIVDGMIDVLAHDIRIATLGPGMIVGEMAFLDGAPRSATVIARTDCTLVPIDQERFAWLLRHAPHAANQFIRLMVGRMRSMTVQIRDGVRTNALPVTYRPEAGLRLRWKPARDGRGREMDWVLEER